ncbi:hypothetical protein D3C85_1748840 [compost metagenome]
MSDAFELGNVFFDHGICGQRLYRVCLDPIAAALAAQFQKLYRRGADVDPQQHVGFFIEESWHYQFPMTFRVLRTL